MHSYLSMMKFGSLHLIPVPLSGADPHQMSIETMEAARSLQYFIAEKAKTARHFLKSIAHPLKMADIEVAEIIKEDAIASWPLVLEWLQAGFHVGLVSEAGMPCVADPGYQLVRLAHNYNIQVIPHAGPNSMLMALMASGLQGQQFTFHGYLPAKKEAARSALISLIQKARSDQGSHIFMETPYRNKQIIDLALSLLPDSFQLSVAGGIGTNKETIRTLSMMDWKKIKELDLGDLPSIYILSAK